MTRPALCICDSAAAMSTHTSSFPKTTTSSSCVPNPKASTSSAIFGTVFRTSAWPSFESLDQVKRGLSLYLRRFAQYRRGPLRGYLKSAGQENAKVNRSILLWSIVFWLLIPICWIPVLAAHTTPGEKDLGLGILAMMCVLLSLALGVVALILTALCIADYLQRRHKSRMSPANESSSH